ncbi:MAG: hypothetical protein YHS30scaffold324_44 [Catenulispora phage 69_17]|jgi:excisionase family DNA binding protein|nr:MAG: hypothetical protein YHS30scaffold324_44 [Catenulispora phage 69_17]
MTVTDLPKLLSSQEAADVVRMHKLTLLRKAREGLIGSIHRGNRVFFTPEQIEAYLASCETKAHSTVKAAKPSRHPKYSK